MDDEWRGYDPDAWRARRAELSGLDCGLCGEPLDEPSVSFAQPTHRACTLREVVGGIGHLIAHDYWCTERGDQDAGLTYRQSALLVDAYCAIVGVDAPVDHR